MKTHIHPSLRITGICLVMASPSCTTYDPQPDRPVNWAQALEVEGVPNLHKVSDRLYRSAQPTNEGIRNLEELGITTVVSLRYFSDTDETAGTAVESIRLPTLTWAPTDEHANSFLEYLSSQEDKTILVHCMHGADRTGAMCAIYRIKLERWEPDEAIREMRHGGFGAHRIWINLAPWVRKITNPDPMDQQARTSPE